MGKFVDKTQLELLIANYERNAYFTGDGRDTPEPYNPDFDTKSIWFPAEEVIRFLQNHQATGLRIYLGMHDKGVMATEYDDGEVMVVLVATKNDENGKEVDLFDPPVSNGGGNDDGDGDGDGDGDPTNPGGGLNHGKICPPDVCG